MIKYNIVSFSSLAAWENSFDSANTYEDDFFFFVNGNECAEVNMMQCESDHNSSDYNSSHSHAASC